MPLRRKVRLRPEPCNKKIADISEADTSKHYLGLEAALGETRKIVMVILQWWRTLGTGFLRVYPNEGTKSTDVEGAYAHSVMIKDGTQRLQYSQSAANNQFELWCIGYYVEA